MRRTGAFTTRLTMAAVKLKSSKKKRKQAVRVKVLADARAAKPHDERGVAPKPRVRLAEAAAAAGKPARKTARRTAQPAIRDDEAGSWWDRLSAERKLDFLGLLLTVIGVLLILGLASTERSLLLGGFMELLAQLFGWGVYVLPVTLIIVGGWLIFRKVERLPRFSLERVVGIGLLFLLLLTLLHASVAAPENAEAEAAKGIGGGAIGGLFVRLLWLGLGSGGAIVAMLAWMTIAMAMTLDVSVQQLFGWMGPSLRRFQATLKNASTAPVPEAPARRIPITTHLQNEGPAGNGNGLTPIETETTEPASVLSAEPPITTTAAPVIQWSLPKVEDILETGTAPSVNEDFIQKRARLIEDTLASLGAPAQVVAISRGPAITQFGVEPLFVESRTGRTRVRVSKIASLSDDLALALAAPRIRIEAPVPGHGYVGIEVPNEEMALVALRDIVESETFVRKHKPLAFALGRDVAGHPIVADLESMPHLLIAGTTGSGKSVCVNAILTCMLLHNTPDDLRLVLVDPKRVELTNYNGIPHLLGPVVVEMERVVGALQWMTREMDKRYHQFAQAGARNIGDYNGRMKLQGGKKLPALIIIIDELADLMMIAPDETEKTITRLAQLARATGIHMVLATQRPSVDVVTGLIKANFPARIAFAVASGVDSRVILDQPGAERLLGRGDMLYQAPDAPSPNRLQGVFVSDKESQALVEYWHAQAGGEVSAYAVAGAPMDPLPAGAPLKQAPLWETEKESEGDPLYDESVDIVRRQGRASVSMLQRRLRIGYTRAARLVDRMQDNGVVGPPEGGLGNRKILDYGPAAPPVEE